MRQLSEKMRRFFLVAMLLISGLISWTPASAQIVPGAKPAVANPRSAKPVQMTKEAILVLLRTVLLAVDSANKTGNYTVLRDLGANGFKANSAAQLSEIFATQRKQGLDMGFTAIFEPQFTLAPQIDPNGLLHMAGFYRIDMQQINFEMLFAPEDNRWKLYGVSIATPVPQQAPSQQFSR